MRCVIILTENIKICSICGKEIKNKKGRACQACRQKYRVIKNKQKAIDYMGGKCSKCGYNKSNVALEFHHVNPAEKEFTISAGYNKSWQKIKHELDKCVLLCANCHRELHNNENNSYPIEVYEKYIHSLSDKETKQKNQKRKDLENQKKIEKRKEIILNSGIDFSKYGWSSKLSKVIGISSSAVVRWVKVHLPAFYKEKCYREKTLDDNDIRNIIEMYTNGKSTLAIARLLKIDVARVSTTLRENNIEINGHLKCSKKVNMIDITTGEILKTFDTISEAGIYCEDNVCTNRSKNPSLKSITAKISKCINKHQKTAYGFRWEEAM